MTRYRIDGAAEWSTYGGPVTVDEAGIHLVEYRSTTWRATRRRSSASCGCASTRPRPQTSVRLNGGAPAAEYIGAVRVGFARSDGAEGSGVVDTEYRLGDGPWTPYTEAFDLAGNGGHRIDFRSRDLAGNVENFRSVMFVIRPTVAASPGSDSTLAPKPGRFAALEPLATRQATLARLRRGLPVHISCQGVQRGTLSLTVSRTTMRRLKLRTRTLLARAVRCGAEGRATVTIKPGTRVRRALPLSGLRARDADAALRRGARYADRDVQGEVVKFSGRMYRAFALALACVLIGAASAQAQAPVKVLVFHGPPDATTTAGVAALEELGADNDFDVDATADATQIAEDNLAGYRAVVFLNTAGNLLNAEQEGALQGFVEAGGGFVGIGSAAQGEPGTRSSTG